jgi:RNA polymerase sigma-70 factor, ECF subfamily
MRKSHSKPLVDFWTRGADFVNSPGDVTLLLQAIQSGDTGAKGRLADLVYAELRGAAAGLMGQERGDHTLQPTALLHEAFLRLFRDELLSKAPNRAYLFGAAARAMREVLADHARRRRAAKRGGAYRRVPLDELLDQLEQEHHVDVLAVHEMLDTLAALHERQTQIITLRFFGGFTVPEIAELLGISVSTVESDFRIARAWLRQQLKGDAE